MRRLLLLSLVLVAPVLLSSAGSAQAHRAGTTVDLVAYSTPRPALQQLIAAFQQTPAGRGVTFTQSYGPSGSQARAVAAGQPADVVFLSNGLDVNTLVQAGLARPNWHKMPYDSIGADTIVSFVVRPGNPKHIHTWADLVKKGVQILTPNPFSSGGAKWNILAAYGVQRKLGKTDKQATAYVQTLFRHVVAQDSSAANAMNTFLSGKGDVLLTYESEALTAIGSGARLGLVNPKQTMLIELPMVTTKSAPTAALDFATYCHSTAGQKIFAAGGYWPVKRAVLALQSMRKYHNRYTAGSRVMFKVSDKLFGGWLQANKVWFDPSTGRMVKIEQNVGGPNH